MKPLMTAVTSPSESMHHSSSPTKTWLIVKNPELEKAFRIFAGTRIKTTSDGRRHLEGVIGTN